MVGRADDLVAYRWSYRMVVYVAIHRLVSVFALQLPPNIDICRSITAKSILTYPLPSSIPVPSFAALGYFSLCFAFGVFIWTILEYSMHRFLFHLDYYLPDTRWAITLHFMLHGVHHYLPMDKLRLVMPPLLFFVLQTPFTKLAHIVFPKAIANGIISGAFAMYVVYDLGKSISFISGESHLTIVLSRPLCATSHPSPSLPS